MKNETLGESGYRCERIRIDKHGNGFVCGSPLTQCSTTKFSIKYRCTDEDCAFGWEEMR